MGQAWRQYAQRLGDKENMAQVKELRGQFNWSLEYRIGEWLQMSLERWAEATL